MATGTAQKSKQLISAPFAWGAGYIGTDTGAQIITNGLCQRFDDQLHKTEILTYDIPRGTHDPKLDEAWPHIQAYMPKLCQTITNSVTQDHTLIVIGGDHSVALGTWSGVSTAIGGKPIGMIWIDAHLDAHTPITSVQGKWGGHFHGMPVAHMLGHGDRFLCELGHPQTKFDPAHLVMFGIRSVEPAETELMQKLGVTVITAEDIKSKGIEACWQQALEIANAAPHGWGLSFDYDALDPSDMPHVGTPEDNGILWDDLGQVLMRSAPQKKLLALEMVEFNTLQEPSVADQTKAIEIAETFLSLI